MSGFIRGASAVLLLAPLFHVISFQSLFIIWICAVIFHYRLLRSARHRWRVNQGGFVSPGFERVAEVFKESLVSHQEKGAAFAVYYKGELVVDLWGGYADYHSLRYRNADSTSMAFSTTKAVTAICLARLYDRGLLDYDNPVMKYWPEFGQNKKSDVTVKTLLCHRAGLITIQDKYKLSLLKDDPMQLGQLLARQEPFWTPGTAQGYHALTFGLYADQLVRRIDPMKRSLGKFFEEEIAKPFDIDFTIGEHKDQFHRACREMRVHFGWKYFFVTTIPVTAKFIGSAIYSLFKYKTIYLMKLIGSPSDWKPRKLNNPDFREIECGASHGVGTARGLAKLMGILANGGKHKDLELLTVDAINKLGTSLSDDFDRVVLRNITYGPGTTIYKIKQNGHKPRQVFGHWGAGGQMAFCDVEEKVGWSYLTNYCNLLHGFIIDHRYAALEKAMYQCLDDLNKNK